MKRALVISVGTGTGRGDIRNPIRKAIRDYVRPEFTIFMVSEASKSIALAIAGELKLAKETFRIHECKDTDDIQAIIADVEKALAYLEKRGYTCGDITVDFTSGTKAMSAGLVAAAVGKRCRTLNYMSGKREGGIVVNGTEKPVQIRPSELYFRLDMERAIAFAKQTQFAAAIKVLADYGAGDLVETSLERLKLARKIFEAYNKWDWFDHAGAAETFENLPAPADSQLRELFPAPSVISRLVAISKRLKEKQYSADAVCDLVNNAARRAIEGKYDDAVARLYRASEMLGQFILKSEYGLDSDDLDRERLTPDEMKLFSNSGEKKALQSGRDKNFTLLAMRGHPVGKAAMESKRFNSAVGQRNGSILAHGNTPMTRGNYDRLNKELAAIAGLGILNFSERCAELQFAWLTD